MKQIKSISLIIVGAVLLSACHNRLIHNRTEAYRDAKSIAPMKIPPEYTATNMTAYYPVPSKKIEDLKPLNLMPPRSKSDIE